MKKVFVSFLIITILIMNVNICNVQALEIYSFIDSLWNNIEGFSEDLDPTEAETVQIARDILQSGGFIMNTLSNTTTGAFINKLASEIDQNQAEQSVQDNITCIQEQIKTISRDGNDIYINDSFKTALVNTANYYADQNNAYVYSFLLSEYASSRGLPTNMYLKLQELISVTSDLMDKYFFIAGNSSNCTVFQIEMSSVPYLYVRKGTVSGQSVQGTLYNGFDNTAISVTGKRWNSATGDFDIDTAVSNSIYGLNVNYIAASPTSGVNTFCFVSRDSRKTIRLFNGAATATDLIYSPYYYNNDVWQDFSTSSGDYTFSPSNINTVTYGDVTEYIDSFNEENGYPPSPTKIEVHIDDKDEENKDTSSGGGSGSGGDDSGGGGGIGSVGDIFGWLKQLGSVIASLIKGIGEFVTEIVTGLVSALTDLLSGIGDLISNITETVPTAFMDWLGNLFSWMPEEWRALLSASLIFMLLWGIIKTIRGS